MNKSDQINELATALSQAQSKMGVVDFNAENPFLHNGYADLGAFISAAKPVLAEMGLSVSQAPFGDGVTCGVTTILMHKSGQWLSTEIALPVGMEKGKSNAQVAGSIITYLRRYSYASILGMYAGDDDDGNTAGTGARRIETKQVDPNTGEVIAPKPQVKAHIPATLMNKTQTDNLFRLWKETHPGKTDEELNEEIKAHLVKTFNHPAEQTTVPEWASVMTALQEAKKAAKKA